MTLARARADSLQELIGAACAQLASLESPRLDAEILLCHLLDVDRAHLYAHPEAVVPAAMAADFTRLVARRSEGYPLAYLTGSREFWSLDLAVNRHTLVPRPETELLVELALANLRDCPEPGVLELGVGSGAVSLAIARERSDARITATDLCRHALAVAQENALRHGMENIDFLHSDWFTELAGRRFNAIVSNPPYVDERDPALWQAPLRHEPRLALDGGHGGLAALARIIAGAGRHLLTGAALLLEHGHDQGARVREMMQGGGFAAVRTERDGAGHERVSVGIWT